MSIDESSRTAVALETSTSLYLAIQWNMCWSLHRISSVCMTTMLRTRPHRLHFLIAYVYLWLSVRLNKRWFLPPRSIRPQLRLNVNNQRHHPANCHRRRAGAPGLREEGPKSDDVALSAKIAHHRFRMLTCATASIAPRLRISLVVATTGIGSHLMSLDVSASTGLQDALRSMQMRDTFTLNRHRFPNFPTRPSKSVRPLLSASIPTTTTRSLLCSSLHA